MPSPSQILVPTVIEEGNRGDRAFDIYSQLLREMETLRSQLKNRS